ncbi:MAG: hypothetical protein JNK70_01515 [Phycisphaerae bacterium]|nr:hypothetical protein [Phycisphaerae bacterium]
MAQASGAMPREARAWTLMGILALALGILVMLMGISLAVMLRRRRRRLLALRSDTARRRVVDPWMEAGRRASPPTAEELEEDRADDAPPSR